MTGEAWPPLLAAALVLGGALLLVRLARERRRQVALRVASVARITPAPAELEAKPREGFFIAETRAGSRRGAELLALSRICRRLGITLSDWPRALMLLQLTAAVGLAAAAFLTLQLFGGAKAAAPAAALAGGLLGWMSPIFLLRHMAAERKRAVTQGFADALELLVICAEAGLALEDALTRVTEELRISQPALAEELAMTSADLQVLPERDQAFANFARRIDEPSIRSVVNTLAQTMRFGTPLAGALRVAAAELRTDSITEMEERAGRLPAMMTLPMMIFILPTILLIVSGPAILRVFDILQKGG